MFSEVCVTPRPIRQTGEHVYKPHLAPFIPHSSGLHCRAQAGVDGIQELVHGDRGAAAPGCARGGLWGKHRSTSRSLIAQ